MRILGIIPARKGSKGVPGKNIRLLFNKPLLEYTACAAKLSSLITETIISSDSCEIIETARLFNITAPFIRPSELARDSSTTLSVLQHALSFFEEKNIFFDAVCLLQPTYPFRIPGFIDECIKKFIKTKADTLLSVVAVPHQYNPHWVFQKDEDELLHISTGYKKIIPRRQDLPEAYIRDGNVYLIKRDVIMTENTLYGKKIAYHISDAEWHVNIDTQEDWNKAEEKASAYAKMYPMN